MKMVRLGFLYFASKPVWVFTGSSSPGIFTRVFHRTDGECIQQVTVKIVKIGTSFK